MLVSNKLAMYLGAECFLGIPWGLFQAITLPYVFDISPAQFKGPASTLLNAFCLFGQVVCCGVLRGAVEFGDTMWQVRIPMLCQYTWLWILAVIVVKAPESPMYLIRNDRNRDASGVLQRLNRDPRFDTDGHLAMLRAINEHEKDTTASMGFMTCFAKHNLRRTEIAMVVYSTQQLVGTPLIAYSVSMVQKGGLGASYALEINMVMYTCCIGASLASIYAIRRFGRRTMWLAGLMTTVGLHLVIGTLALVPLEEGGILSFVIAFLLVLFAGTYNFTTGPVGYAIVAEVPATRLKTSTNALARGSFIVFNVINLFLVPSLLGEKPEGWGVGAKTSFLYALTAGACLYWAWHRLPETKGLTPAQIDHMFDKYNRSRTPSAAASTADPFGERRSQETRR